MAYPYDRSLEERERARRHELSEDEARRAERRAEQERQWDRGGRDDRRGADYRAGWYGERLSDRERMRGRGGLEEHGGTKDRAGSYDEDAAFYERYDEPHAYRRRAARMRDESWRDESGRDESGREESGRDEPGEHRGFERNARQAGRSVARGWRHFAEGVRHAFADDPAAYDRAPRRGGGMFGGEDRRGSLFSHRDGLSARPVGAHSGKGPKGYVRTDNRILEDVCDRLADDGRLDACDIEVKVDAGEVTLNGQVKAREDKRRAEDIAESVSGVKHLQNNLRVRPPAPPAAPPSAPRSSAARPDAEVRATPAPRSSVQPAAPTSAQITGPKDGPPKAASPRAAAPKAPPSRPN